MSHTRKIAYNTLAQLVGKAVGIVISLATIAALFRYLGVEGVGKYTTAFAFVAFIAIFADFGLGWTMLRELSIAKDKTKVFKNIFSVRFLLALVIHLSAIGIIWFFPYTRDVKVAVGVLSVAWFFQTLNSTVVSVFIQNYRLDITVAAEVVGKLIVLGLVLWASRLGLGLAGIMLAYLCGNIVNLTINLIFATRFVGVGFAYDKKYWLYCARQAIPIGLTLVFGFIYYKIDSLMLSWMKTMTEVGIYGTPYKLLEVLQTFPALFLGAAFPLVTRYIIEGDERMYPAFQKQFDFLALIAVPVVALCFVLARPIIAFIAGARGDEFTQVFTVELFGHGLTSVTCLKILIISVGISFISTLYTFTIVSLGKQRQMVWPTIGFAVFNVILNLILIPHFSYIGAAVATLLTEAIILITASTIVRKNIHLPIRLNSFLKIILSGVICAAVAQIMYIFHLNLFVILILSAAIYTVFILLFRAVTFETIRSIIRSN